MVERTLISLPSQLQLIDRLQHLIYLSSSLIFVSSEPGSGKSTLTENLSNCLNSELQQVYISLTDEPTLATLRQKIVSQLYEAPLFNADDRLLGTFERLEKNETNSIKRLITIDNANLLPVDFIIELCELFTDFHFSRYQTLNILLLADPLTTLKLQTSIEANLNNEIKSVLNQVELKLPELTADEAIILLQHNVQQVDYKENKLPRNALNKQLERCKGNPLNIIQFAEGLSAGGQQVETKRSILLNPVLLASLFILFIGIVAVYINIQPDSIQQSPKKNMATPIDSKVENEKVLETLAGKWSFAEEKIKENRGETSSISPVTGDSVFTDLLNTSTMNNQLQYSHEGPPLLRANSVGIAEKRWREEEVLSQHIVDVEMESTQGLEQIIETKMIAFSEDESIEKDSPHDIDEAIEAKKQDNTIHDPVLEAPPADDWLTEKDVLLAKKEDHYTIQLLGISSLTQFKKQHISLPDNVYLYSTMRGDNPFYIITYGDYDSKSVAKDASKNLPAQFQNMPVWVKEWRLVHQDLRLNKK